MVGLDVDGGKVKQLVAGESFVEDIPDERLAAALATGRYLPTDSIGACAGFDYAVISVPHRCGRATPTSPTSRTQHDRSAGSSRRAPR